MSIQWEESKHPRDNDGKFTSGGGTPAEHKRLQELGIEPDGIDNNGLFEQNSLALDDDGYYIYNQEEFDAKLVKRDKIFKQSLDDLESQYSENDFIRLKMSIDRYTGPSYEYINKMMRGEKYDSTIEEQFNKIVDRLNNAIELYDNPRKINVFRNIDISALKDYDISESNIEDLIGKTISDKAFSSCSLDKDTAKIFAQKTKEKTKNSQVILDLSVPKGKGKGMPLWQYSNYKIEQEFLVNSNSKIKITSVIKEKDYYIVKGDVQ